LLCGQSLALLDKLHDVDTSLWYARECVRHGWSRTILELQIDRRVHERQGESQNNFALVLPPAASDMEPDPYPNPYPTAGSHM
jgi:predicted nuclease of restriction endonuclease-like (RecB) superfamily